MAIIAIPNKMFNIISSVLDILIRNNKNRAEIYHCTM